MALIGLQSEMKKEKLNSQIQNTFGVNKRHANSVINFVAGELSSAIECYKRHIDTLDAKLKSVKTLRRSCHPLRMIQPADYQRTKIMQIEDYFDFLAPNDIRIKGTRVGIESLLYEYIHRKLPPEEIVPKFRSVTLEQVYATILYYLQNREKVGKYFADWLEWGHQQRKAQEMNPHPGIIKFQQRIAKYGRDPEVYKALRAQGVLGLSETKEVAETSHNDSLSKG